MYPHFDGLMHKELLIWDSTKKRIMYKKYEAPASSSLDNAECYGDPEQLEGEYQEINSRPLIETSFEIRKSIYSHLPNFLESIK